MSENQTVFEAAAALLRAAGWTVVPPPPPPVTSPRVGMRVRYVRGETWGPSIGDVGTIIEVREPSADDGFAREPVFWVRLDRHLTGQFYTTPYDVEALDDRSEDAPADWPDDHATDYSRQEEPWRTASNDPDLLTCRDPELDLDALEAGHNLALQAYRDAFVAGRTSDAAAWEALLVAAGYGWPATPKESRVS